MVQKRTIGVLVMSYGTPESMDKIVDYYTHIRRGRPPSEEQLQELTERYRAIAGGVFPLRENTNKQVETLQQALNSLEDGNEYICFQGMKHAQPFIEDGVQAIADAGIREAVGLVLAPHYSVMSVGSYIERADQKARELDVNFRFAKCYHTRQDLIDAFVERLHESLGQFDGVSEAEIEAGIKAGIEAGFKAGFKAGFNDVHVLFTAHSLPEKILDKGDPYVDQLMETSRLIADQAGLVHWQFAWQSAGRTADPWLGPDILDVMEELKQKGTSNILVCPIGFVSDHLEILYDLDIEAKQVAGKLGIQFARVRSLNQDPKYIRLLQEVVVELASREPGSYDM